MAEQPAFEYSGSDSNIGIPEHKDPASKRISSADVVKVPDNSKVPIQGTATPGIDLQTETEEINLLP